MSNVWDLCEKLVATVARAFYTDSYVVVLDALMREKYIMEEELGPRLKLSEKEVRKITTQLESEMLIKVENVTIGDNGSHIKCYYIDYKVFFQAVKYRVHLMQKALYTEEKSELHEVFYQCPTCKEKSNSLMAMRMRNAQGKFLCSHCCPQDNFKTTASEKYYILEEVDNRGQLSTVQALHKKMNEQFNSSKDHDGIFSLLSSLTKISNIPTNKPSDNMKVGIRTSTIMDEDVQENVKVNMQFATGQFGSSLIRKTAPKSSSNTSNKKGGDMFKTDFDINIIDSEDPSHSSSRSNNNNNGIPMPGNGLAAARNSVLPEFLRDSRVIGAAGVVKAAEALAEERSSKRPRLEDSTDLAESEAQANSEMKEDGENNNEHVEEEVEANDEEEGDDDDEDDVVWED